MCTFPWLLSTLVMSRVAAGRRYVHGVHGGVAGDCAGSLILALVELNVDGRLSIVRHLQHAILEVGPNRLHSVGVCPRGSGHHVMDWHSWSARARLACASGGTKKRGWGAAPGTLSKADKTRLGGGKATRTVRGGGAGAGAGADGQWRGSGGSGCARGEHMGWAALRWRRAGDLIATWLLEEVG